MQEVHGNPQELYWVCSSSSETHQTSFCPSGYLSCIYSTQDTELCEWQKGLLISSEYLSVLIQKHGSTGSAEPSTESIAKCQGWLQSFVPMGQGHGQGAREAWQCLGSGKNLCLCSG